MPTDKERLDFLERRAKLSRTGITFEWFGDKPNTGFRFLSYHHIGDPKKSVRDTIDGAINETLAIPPNTGRKLK